MSLPSGSVVVGSQALALPHCCCCLVSLPSAALSLLVLRPSLGRAVVVVWWAFARPHCRCLLSGPRSAPLSLSVLRPSLGLAVVVDYRASLDPAVVTVSDPRKYVPLAPPPASLRTRRPNPVRYKEINGNLSVSQKPQSSGVFTSLAERSDLFAALFIPLAL